MDKETLEKILVSFRLEASILVSPLRESADNAVFVVGHEKNKRILRISKRLPVEDVSFECEAVNYLARNGVPVPLFLPASSGECYA